MMRTLKPTKRYKKAFQKCKKRGYNMRKLYDILNIIATREFKDDEIYALKVHALNNDRRYTDCMELHIGGRNSDWLLIYHIQGDSVKFEDMLVELENTGTHADCFESEQTDNELIWL